jgi:hypothetical protein
VSTPARNAATNGATPETVTFVPKSITVWFGALRRWFSET